MIERKNHLDTLAISIVLACCLFWGFQQILIKVTFSEIPPLWQASLRFIGATAVLWLWCRARGIALFTSDGTLGGGLAAGLLFAAELICIYLGIRDTTVSRLTVFVYTSPFVVALLLPRFVPSEKLHGVQWAGLVIAFCAVGLAFAEGFLQPSLPNQLRGDALALAAGVLWGLTTLVLRTTKMATASAEKVLFYQIAVTAAVCPLVSLAMGEKWSLDYSVVAWGSLALQTVIGAFASYLAWMWLLRHYPATQLSSFTFLTPVFALVFGVALLDEPLSLQLMLALVGVGVGIVLVNRKAVS